MQINSWWVKKKKISPALWQSLGDPCVNVKVGAWILSQCIQEHGYTWKAVGCYNAVTEWKQEKYAREIFEVYRAEQSFMRGETTP
jgi:soluble lytic murein transglycosylase-like protein